jgi:hypothetical protein
MNSRLSAIAIGAREILNEGVYKMLVSYAGDGACWGIEATIVVPGSFTKGAAWLFAGQGVSVGARHAQGLKDREALPFRAFRKGG